MLAFMLTIRVAVGALLLASCGGVSAETRVPPVERHAHLPADDSRRQKPSLAPQDAPVVVLLVVDQLASWVFEQRRSSFSEKGGFNQLLREGIYGSNLRYEHATTSTAPGHAALFTGLPPRESGIFANERLDDHGKPTSMFADPSTKAIGVEPLEGPSSSNASLRAETLADALRAQRPSAQIIALSLKDRASVPGGGQKPTLSVWFDADRESFVTSSALAASLPGWVGAEQASLKRALGDTWQPLDEAWLEQHSPTTDDQPGEGDFGSGPRFPHDLSQAQPRGKAFRGYPAADAAILSLARSALAELPREDGAPILLMLSLSAFDYVGHVQGPDSWESWEVLRELDAELGGLFDELEQRFGERLSIVLSADHGTAPLPETTGNPRARPWCGGAADPFERPCTKGERLQRSDLAERAQKAAREQLGPGDWIRAVVEPFVYFSAEAAKLPAARRRQLEQVVIRALQRHPGVARVFSTRELAGPCPKPDVDTLPALVCRSLSPGAGDLYIASKPGSFFDPNLISGHGINHGSPYLYDRTVPVLVRSARLAHPGKEITSVLRPADVTATAAALLQIEPPRGASNGRDLTAE